MKACKSYIIISRFMFPRHLSHYIKSKHSAEISINTLSTSWATSEKFSENLRYYRRKLVPPSANKRDCLGFEGCFAFPEIRCGPISGILLLGGSVLIHSAQLESGSKQQSSYAGRGFMNIEPGFVHCPGKLKAVVSCRARGTVIHGIWGTHITMAISSAFCKSFWKVHS